MTAKSVLSVGMMVSALSLAVLAPVQADEIESTRLTRTGDAEEDSSDLDVVGETKIERVRVGEQEAGRAGEDSVEQTVITEKEVNKSNFRNEAVGIKPQFGVLAIDDAVGSGNSRAIGGLIIDTNLLGRAQTVGGKPYFGPSFGILYSHLGEPGGDFFGLNNPSGRDRGTHLLMLPINLKAGYTFRDVIRLAAHGGANVIYQNLSNRSAAAGTVLRTSGSSWSAHPNAGLDLEFGVGKNAAILIRPDWTFASDDTVFTGTLGVTFPMS